MQHHLNISTAAKLVGISRRQIQKEIKAGNLDVFEGDVSVDSLVKFYPEVRLENEKELDRVERIQKNAVFKVQMDSIPPERVMADHINKLQVRLFETEQQVREYESLLLEATSRLEAMQKDCDRKQKQTLAAFIAWMMGQYQQRHH
jgi:CDP-4-dehydro-6-deoxyglucose reductase, E3